MCKYFARRWDSEGEKYIYWDFRKKKILSQKPKAMGDDEIPLRVVCYKCEKNPATRYCVVCKDENGPECDSCFFKRHGPDDLTDDVAAAKLLGTESFAMAIPLHRHGWLELPVETKICFVCRKQYAEKTCNTCSNEMLIEDDNDESGVNEDIGEEVDNNNVQGSRKSRRKHVQTSFTTKMYRNEYCKVCWTSKHQENASLDHSFDSISFRLRQRGMEDLDSDEEGAYRAWSEDDDED